MLLRAETVSPVDVTSATVCVAAARHSRVAGILLTCMSLISDVMQIWF